jgi:hypothetical protein
VQRHDVAAADLDVRLVGMRLEARQRIGSRRRRRSCRRGGRCRGAAPAVCCGSTFGAGTIGTGTGSPAGRSIVAVGTGIGGCPGPGDCTVVVAGVYGTGFTDPGASRGGTASASG